ncbi:MAG: hypothetical protein SPL13_04570 [Clostridia bacterium]|nr:hypothetical protein [Clostridia bacterium]
MKKLLKSISIIIATAFAFTFVACSNGSSKKPDDEQREYYSTLSGNLLTDAQNVHWIGRTHYDETAQAVYTYYTATGFTVDFEGTTLSVTYSATNTSSSKNRPYFISMVDGVAATEGTSFSLTKQTQTVDVAKGLTEGRHTVTVLKRSEPENSLTAITKIQTDGAFRAPTVRDSLKFQIIGSSGISGHGALGNSGDSWTTANSSSMHGFGYLAASKFGAETQFVSASGMGMVWSYRGVSPMPESYEATGLIASYDKNGNTVSVTANGQWDHSKWVPDVVIANIGGNDWNNTISTYSSGTAERIAAENQFKQAVNDLICRIHELYPSAKIIWTCNSTSSGNGGLANQVVQTLSFKNQVHMVSIDNTKDGADNHASYVTQQKNANIVANAITARCGYAQIG